MPGIRLFSGKKTVKGSRALIAIGRSCVSEEQQPLFLKQKNPNKTVLGKKVVIPEILRSLKLLILSLWVNTEKLANISQGSEGEKNELPKTCKAVYATT